MLLLTFGRFSQPQIVLKLFLFPDISKQHEICSNVVVVILQYCCKTEHIPNKTFYHTVSDIMKRVGEFKFLLPFSAAFIKE